jgi:hypothetical protein
MVQARTADSLLDPHIRAAIIYLLHRDDPSAVVFEELPLARGDRRADIVSVNGVISGYEIKSQRDSLLRLIGQAECYAQVCEYMNLIVASRHFKRARRILPKSWGLSIIEEHPKGVCVRGVRKAHRNSQLNKESLIRILWRNECARALRNNGILVSKDTLVADIWEKLSLFPLPTVLNEVRTALKSRCGSEFDSKQIQDDGSCPKRSIGLHCRGQHLVVPYRIFRRPLGYIAPRHSSWDC